MRRSHNMRTMVARRLVREEQGIALVMALGMLVVCAIMVVAVTDYTSTNQRTTFYSKTRMTAFDAADAGMNDALAVLNLPSNNALDPDILPKCHTANPDTTTPGATNPTWFSSPTNFTSQATWSVQTYGNATSYWCGDLDRYGAQWFLWSVGSLKNPTSPTAGNVTKRLSSLVTVVPTLTQPLNNPVWNYLYAGHTGSACDQRLNNNISGASRMYVAGNLCLSPNVNLAQSTVIVGGNLDISNNAAVGASTNMSTRVETYVGGSCRYAVGSWVACSGNQDANHVYSKLSNGTTVGVNHTAPVIAPPAADFATWYENSIPGPSQTCTTSSGTVPTFDTNYPSRDNSVSAVADLTPSSSFKGRLGNGADTTLNGAMTAAQTTLTVASASGFPTTTFNIRVDDEYMT